MRNNQRSSCCYVPSHKRNLTPAALIPSQMFPLGRRSMSRPHIHQKGGKPQNSRWWPLTLHKSAHCTADALRRASKKTPSRACKISWRHHQRGQSKPDRRLSSAIHQAATGWARFLGLLQSTWRISRPVVTTNPAQRSQDCPAAAQHVFPRKDA
jgi:hypothetical protein